MFCEVFLQLTKSKQYPNQSSKLISIYEEKLVKAKYSFENMQNQYISELKLTE